MPYLYNNITTTDATLLNPKGSDIVYNNITIVNTSASYSYSIDLYISREVNNTTEERTYVGQGGDWNALDIVTQTYYILKTVKIPVGSTLVLEAHDLVIDALNYDFYIKVNDITGSGVTVDVSINLELIKTSPYPSSNGGVEVSSGY